MALAKRRRDQQLEAFVVASDLPKSPGHPFCTALNRLMAENSLGHQPAENIVAPLSSRHGELNTGHRWLMIRRSETRETRATGR
jgi:hypothetical protein